MTLDNCTVEIDADVVALHQVRMPAPWEARTINTTKLEDTFEPVGPIFYADAFDPGQQEIPNLTNVYAGNIQLMVGDGKLDQQTLTEFLRLHILELHRNGFASRQPVGDFFDASAPPCLPLIRTQAGDLVSRQPIGRVKVKFASRPHGNERLRRRAAAR